jgi:hypothetical protein
MSMNAQRPQPSNLWRELEAVCGRVSLEAASLVRMQSMHADCTRTSVLTHYFPDGSCLTVTIRVDPPWWSENDRAEPVPESASGPQCPATPGGETDRPITR